MPVPFVLAQGAFSPPVIFGIAAVLFVVALIFFAAALNYVDRQVLALLKPILQTEFSWDNQDFAHLGSVFQLSAAIALPTRPASIVAASTGPSSLSSVKLMTPPNLVSSPNWRN